MRGLVMSLLIAVGAITANTALAQDKAKNRDDCKVVEQNSAKDNSGTLSSSVTAGGGRVSAHTTGAGNSVTVRSGDGKTSSSVAVAGSSGGSTVVAGTGSGDDCTITINRNRK